MASSSRTFLRIAPEDHSLRPPGHLSFSSFPDPIAVDTDEPTIYVSSDWQQSGDVAVEITVTDGETVWQKQVVKYELTRQKPPEFGESEYLEATRAALAGVNDPKGQETKCEVSRHDFTAELSWFLIPESEVMFKLGSLDLTSLGPEATSSTWMSWIDDLTKERSGTLDRCEKLEVKVKDLQDQRNKVLKMHEEWVHEKREEIDRVVFKKFKEVLNAKKAKIRELMAANTELANRNQALEEHIKRLETEAAERRNGNSPAGRDLTTDLTTNIDDGSSRNPSRDASREPSPSPKRLRTEEPSTLQATPAKPSTTATTPKSSRVAHSSDSDEMEPPSLFGPSAFGAKPALAARRPPRKRNQETPPGSPAPGNGGFLAPNGGSSRNGSPATTPVGSRQNSLGKSRSLRSVGSNASEDAESLLKKI
ncbi:hypothetical protein HDV00_008991 [Rhizophlyctis rosea]|nr:hypothetical protein HDV00_008991 [Rhizophlyctis rosea]